MIKDGFQLIRNLIVKNASLMRPFILHADLYYFQDVIRVIYCLTQTRKIKICQRFIS